MSFPLFALANLPQIPAGNVINVMQDGWSCRGGTISPPYLTAEGVRTWVSVNQQFVLTIASLQNNTNILYFTMGGNRFLKLHVTYNEGLGYHVVSSSEKIFTARYTESGAVISVSMWSHGAAFPQISWLCIGDLGYLATLHSPSRTFTGTAFA